MKIAMLLKDLPVGTLLFTHPPRREWRGLSEEQRVVLFETLVRANKSDYEIFQAIEAKLKEKNHHD